MEVSVAVTVKVNAPVAVGVPEIAPAGESDNPVGIAPLVTANVKVPFPPEAVKL